MSVPLPFLSPSYPLLEQAVNLNLSHLLNQGLGFSPLLTPLPTSQVVLHTSFQPSRSLSNDALGLNLGSSIPQIEGIDNSNLPPLATPKLFISGLSRITTDEKLKEAFSRYGQLLEAKVITDRVSGRSKGFGFVKYSTIEEAEEARKGMNGHFLDGWVIFVDPAKSRAQKATAKQPETCSSQSGVKANKTVGWCG
ncbi:RNA binding protein [Rhynchospora pubera]|uniref:RNA binding protein n=1 Tax=Rhynchospora pubera TaxID=906938 RepID=A0AAV8HPP1_9POAL|nr:RNA binding protein [Rhynchospora pubera]